MWTCKLIRQLDSQHDIIIDFVFLSQVTPFLQQISVLHQVIVHSENNMKRTPRFQTKIDFGKLTSLSVTTKTRLQNYALIARLFTIRYCVHPAWSRNRSHRRTHKNSAELGLIYHKTLQAWSINDQTNENCDFCVPRLLIIEVNIPQ